MSQSAIATTDPVVFQCSGGLIKGKLSVDLGRVELTGRYLVFYRKPFWTRMFGLLGALLAMGMKGKRAIELDLTKIASIGRGKYGVNKRVLDVAMLDGTQYRILIDKYDDMVPRLRDVIALRGAKVVDAGPERWQVVAA